jgi:hypothetical protein
VREPPTTDRVEIWISGLYSGRDSLSNRFRAGCTARHPATLPATYDGRQNPVTPALATVVRFERILHPTDYFDTSILGRVIRRIKAARVTTA